MSKYTLDIERLLVGIVIGLVVGSFLILTLGCTSQSAGRFEPTRKVDVATEQSRQAIAGSKGPYSGMDCLELIRIKQEYCYQSGNCTALQENTLRRDERRLNKHHRSQCVYDTGQIRSVIRSLTRGR